MTPEPTTSILTLRRLSVSDDLGGADALMAGYVTEIQRKLFDGYGVRLEDATPDAELLVEITGLLEPPHRSPIRSSGTSPGSTTWPAT
jgi:hypothetical protein